MDKVDIKLNDNEGFNLVYAKKCGSVQRLFCKNRKDVTEFFIKKLNDIDFLSINDVTIDINKLVENNKVLSRYLKLKRIYEL